MRKKLLGLALAGALLVPAAASAATFAYTGSLELGLGTLPGITIPDNGGVIDVECVACEHLTTLIVPATNFGPFNSSVPVTASMTVLSVRFSSVANTTGIFTGNGGSGHGGLMGLTGLAKICLVFDATCGYVNVPVPLTGGIGIGGTQFVTGSVNITLQHTGWTTGTITVTTHSADTTMVQNVASGGVHGPLSATSSTVQNSGTIQLVTVTKAFTSLTASFPELPLFGTMTLHIIPEPGTALLLGAGVIGLVTFGRKKMRK